MICEIAAECVFAEVYGKINGTYWKTVCGVYCHGPGFKICQRRLYYREHFRQAPLELLPAKSILPPLSDTP